MVKPMAAVTSTPAKILRIESSLGSLPEPCSGSGGVGPLSVKMLPDLTGTLRFCMRTKALYCHGRLAVIWRKPPSRQGVSVPPTASDLSSAAFVKPSLALVIVHGTNPALTTVLCRFTIADLA